METSLKLDRRTRSNVTRLALAQALAGGNAAVVVATGGIVGAALGPSPALATLPVTVFAIGMALATLPAGWLARYYGRRTAFLSGAGCGAAAGLIAALAVVIGSFALFCLATLFAGFYAAVIQSFRFAAADGASPAFRPRAIAWVLAGGIFGGLLGPQLVTWTMQLWLPYLFAASYLAQAGVALVAALVLAGVDLPRPERASHAAGRPLGVIVRQPRFMAAAACGIVSYGLMNMVMTSAPLAMHMCGLPIAASNFAIQWHIVAMYGPSFATGSLIARFGAQRVVAAGLLLIVGAAAVGLTGITAWHFMATLVLLGLGWNFGFIGASALVLETHRAEERTRVQAFNDFLVFGTMAFGSFLSGRVLAAAGWDAVVMIVFPLVALALALLLSGGMLRRRVAAAS